VISPHDDAESSRDRQLSRLRPRPPQRTSGILVLWLNQETVHQRSLAVSSGTVDIHRTISNPSNASLDPPFTALSPSAWHHIFILHTSPHVQSPPITCIDTNQEKRHTHTVLFNHSSQGPSPTGISDQKQSGELQTIILLRKV